MSFFKKTATVAVASSLVFGAFGATAASALAPSPAAPAPQQANNDIEKLREQVKKAIADNKHLNDAQRQYLNSLVAAATTKVDLAGAAAVAAIYNPALFGTDFVAAFKKELLERDVPGVTKENKDRWGEIAQKVAELKTGAAPAETTKPADANKPAETTKPADKPAEGNKPA
ncbi:MAG: hypothetical protein Q4C71_06270, partial [Microbacteriaceae bacterium]|nr:hypothetical protein [Microbacteriaceae bacterium]